MITQIFHFLPLVLLCTPEIEQSKVGKRMWPVYATNELGLEFRNDCMISFHGSETLNCKEQPSTRRELAKDLVAAVKKLYRQRGKWLKPEFFIDIDLSFSLHKIYDEILKTQVRSIRYSILF